MNTHFTVSDEMLPESDDYARLIEASPNATLFHAPEWLSVVHARVHGGVRVLKTMQGGETVAVLPHVHARVGPFRFLLSPPPGLGMQYLGPAIPNWTQLKQDKKERRLLDLAGTIAKHLRERRTKYFQIRFAPGLDDVRAFQWLGFNGTPRYTYTLHLDDERALWKNLKGNVRGHIRKHVNEIQVGLAREDEWRLFQTQLASRYNEQGLFAPLPDGYLDELRKTHGDRMHLLMARRNGASLGGSLMVRFRKRMALWQGTYKGPTGLPVNDVLVWNGIRFALEANCTEFELMGANNQRIADFKSKFNPDLKLYLELRRLPAWAAGTNVAARLRRGGFLR